MKEFTIKNKNFRIGYNKYTDPHFGYNYDAWVDFCHEFSIGRFYICWF